MYKELGVTNFVSQHKTSLVATRTRLLHQNSVVTLSKSLTTEYKKNLREPVAIENCILRQKLMTKTEDFVTIELSMSRQNDQFGPEI